MSKTFIIATALMAAALTGILSTTSSAFAQISPETEQEQELDQEFIVSGESNNGGCAALDLGDSAASAPPNGELTEFECGFPAAPPPPTLLPSSRP